MRSPFENHGDDDRAPKPYRLGDKHHYVVESVTYTPGDTRHRGHMVLTTKEGYEVNLYFPYAQEAELRLEV